jgi:hypothetical protein
MLSLDGNTKVLEGFKTAGADDYGRVLEHWSTKGPHIQVKTSRYSKQQKW